MLIQRFRPFPFDRLANMRNRPRRNCDLHKPGGDGFSGGIIESHLVSLDHFGHIRPRRGVDIVHPLVVALFTHAGRELQRWLPSVVLLAPDSSRGLAGNIHREGRGEVQASRVSAQEINEPRCYDVLFTVGGAVAVNAALAWCHG